VQTVPTLEIDRRVANTVLPDKSAATVGERRGLAKIGFDFQIQKFKFLTQ
jgi:hypothetical protein